MNRIASPNPLLSCDELNRAADEMHQLLTRLFPIHRSMAGPGLRETLAILAESIPIELTEVPTGSSVLDWIVPQEWAISDAYIQDAATGERVVNYEDSNLHVFNHSHPIRATMSWHDLKSHLVTNPEMPDAIPYQTAFFRDAWGFCLEHHRYQQLERDPERVYDVLIDAEFTDGALTLGEVILPGETEDEFLIHAHTCHPSLANDNLSGIVLATRLASILAQHPRRLTYRFVFAPATIGAIAWLDRHRAIPPIRHGLVLTLLGDSAPLTYKRSVRANAQIDRTVSHVVKHRSIPGSVRDFVPWGYDERQYGSPAFHLPVGCLMRSVHDEFPEYHTSADSPSFVSATALRDSLEAILEVVFIAEHNQSFRHCFPAGEPMLGRRGFFEELKQVDARNEVHKAALWVLSLSNSAYDLLTIADRADLKFEHVQKAATILLKLGLIE